MRLTVLVDNNTLVDRYMLAEPGLSFFIEDEESGKRVLWDAGYSNAFLRNAEKLGINLLMLDHVAISHGHLDHTWGLLDLVRLYTNAKIENLPHGRPSLVAHPDMFYTKAVPGLEEIGSLVSADKLENHFPLKLSREPVWLTDRLVFLGEIPRVHEFENVPSLGEVYVDGSWQDDDLLDDSALAYVGSEGLVIILGCAHAGVCNTIDHARKVCGEQRVVDVIGGLHLQAAPQKRLEQTADFLKKLELHAFHPCHCTDLQAKIALAQKISVNEAGCGLILHYS